MSVELSPTTARPRYIKTRSIALGALIGLSFLYLAGHLFTLQVIRGLEYERQARAVSRRELPIIAQRGEIFDRHHDIPLVVNQDSFAIDLIPGELSREQLPQTFDLLSRLLNLPEEEISKRVPEKYFHLYQPIEIKSGVDFETIAYLAEHLEEYPGVAWHNKPVRSYLEGGAMAHIIGYVGDITREELQVLYNQGYGFSSVLGKDGLEKRYDLILRGKDGSRFRVVDVQERNLGQKPEEDIPPVPGKDLVLTIDRSIQRLAVESLGDRVGSVIVLKPATGEVLAMVSWPSYDANLLYTDQANAEFKRLSLDPASPFLNRTIQSAYPPASTFKVVLATALVEEEAFPLGKTINCTGQMSYGDRVFRDHVKTGHGPMNLFSGLAQSCDIYFYTIGDILGVERITFYAREYGLGTLTGIDLPAEVSGFVPSPEWKERVHHMKWLGGDTINISIGQGFLATTPIQLANMVAMVANEGRIYRPFLVKEVRDRVSGETVSRTEPQLIHTSHIRRETFRTVQEAMRRVVTDGTANVVITTKAVQVAGKTGTAEVGLENRWHSWFAAYAPYQAANPDDLVAMVVMVEARNDWEWWAPKAADVIFQGIFAHQSYQEALDTLRPWWYVQQLQEERARLRAAQTQAQLDETGRTEVPGPRTPGAGLPPPGVRGPGIPPAESPRSPPAGQPQEPPPADQPHRFWILPGTDSPAPSAIPAPAPMPAPAPSAPATVPAPEAPQTTASPAREPAPAPSPAPAASPGGDIGAPAADPPTMEPAPADVPPSTVTPPVTSSVPTTEPPPAEPPTAEGGSP
jgi:penicillin-binding protein 2